MGRYTSDEFYHFVGRKTPTDDEANYQVLKKVLHDRCVSHAPHAPGDGTTGYTINWSKSLLSEELFIPTVVCFCDIPFEHLHVHIEKYGKFGLSLPRELLIKYGARPVIYVPLQTKGWLYSAFDGGHAVVKNIEQVFRGFREQVLNKLPRPRASRRGIGAKVASYEEAIDGLDYVLAMDFLALIKPFNSQLGEGDPNNFYMEREWRRFGYQKFEPSDIGRIFVSSGFESRLAREMPEYAAKIEPTPAAWAG